MTCLYKISYLSMCFTEYPAYCGRRGWREKEMKDKVVMAAGIVIVAVISFATGLYAQRERITHNAVVTYEERNGTAWVYMSIDGNVYAYDPVTGQKEE